MTARRYDIDWIRVIAIALLLLYHTAIGFQSWGIMIGFITNAEPWPGLWMPMTLLNVWRIPLLFYVSGMGVYFALRNREWTQLLAERSRRILLPFLFGSMVLVPVHVYLWQHYYGYPESYVPNPGHLWFLGNIFLYVLLLLPAFRYLKKNENGWAARCIRTLLRSPWGLLPVLGAFVLEEALMDPKPFEMYAMTWHGFALGLLAFFFGFCFVLAGETFWPMIGKWKALLLLGAVALYSCRLYLRQETPGYAIAIESNCWILAVLAYGHRYLNRPGKVLAYLSESAYPVYMVHMICLYTSSVILFPLDLPVVVKFLMVLLLTFTGCFACYELLIRRIPFLRVLFGLKRSTGPSG